MQTPSPDSGAWFHRFKTLVKTLAGRTVWLAASTHEGEEEMVSRAHREARRSVPGLLLILAPRHPERGDHRQHGQHRDDREQAPHSFAITSSPKRARASCLTRNSRVSPP